MNPVVSSRVYPQPPVCVREILRYAGCRTAEPDTVSLLQTCLRETEGTLHSQVCYCILPVSAGEGVCDFGAFCLRSEQLCENLRGCRRAVLFAATVGVGPDRLIARYGRLSPAKALMFQAIGAERIEALCDVFCADMEKETGMTLRPRFSPGYGDLPLGTQKDIFALLGCSKRIGLSLNDSLLMSPSKSVTAFAGFEAGEKNRTINKCSVCEQKDCSYRGTL